MRTSVLWLPQSPETAGARTHRPDSAFVTLLWNAAGLLPCKRASTGPCKPLCVHCKDLGCRRRGWKKKTRREPSPAQTQARADQHLGSPHSGESAWCCVLYITIPLSSTGNHCSFILISSTRNKSNLKAVFQPWAGRKNPFSFQEEQSNIYVQLAAVSRALTPVSHLKVATNEQCGHR